MQKLLAFLLAIGIVTASALNSVELGPSFRTFQVNSEGGELSGFTASIPDNSLATFVWENGQQPKQWLTTANGNGFKYALEPLEVTVGGDVDSVITVNPGQKYQAIDGFGAALTDSAAELISQSSKRDDILQKLFSSDGASLNILRVPMGASDLMYDGNNIFTYEDNKGDFSIAKSGTTINVLKQAKAIIGKDMKILGTPWSAPGWMKRGGTLLPNECGSDVNELSPEHFDDYASYFKNFVDAFASEGLKPWMVSMQNEPENCKTKMPTTQLTSDDEVVLSKKLRSKIPADVKILGWDHNWNNIDYVDNLVENGAADAIGYHCYDGTNYKDQTQKKPTYMTECSGFTDQSENVAGNMGWEVSNLIIGPMRFGSKGAIYWSAVQRNDGSPSLNGNDACKTCRGLIGVTNDNNDYTLNQDFYFWAQFSKFVKPGAVRIESSQSGSLSTVAFRQGEENILVVLNSASKADGGSAGSDTTNYKRTIVQWNGDQSNQKSSWLVGADGYRRWISDISTFNCLKYDAGIPGPVALSSGSLDRYLNIKDVWAVCGTTTMGTRSELETGTYLKSPAGARLTLGADGLTAKDSTGKNRWSPKGNGNRLILQEDQNLVFYNNNEVVWASNTVGSGAIWLSLRDDGTFALFNKDNKQVWMSDINSES